MIWLGYFTYYAVFVDYFDNLMMVIEISVIRH